MMSQQENSLMGAHFSVLLQRSPLLGGLKNFKKEEDGAKTNGGVIMIVDSILLSIQRIWPCA